MPGSIFPEPMRSFMMAHDEERLVLVFSDETDCPVGVTCGKH